MRALIVEDQDEYARFIAGGLQSNGFAVDLEMDGEKALWKAKTTDYDLILLDIRLPRKSGIEVLGELRKKKNKTPCILTTVESEIETKVRSFELGADDYLVKPFAMSELIARVHAVLRRGAALVDREVRSGYIRVDCSRYQAYWNNKEINLRRKEYDLLYYFIQNPGRVISRAILLEKIWDMNADPFTNTVDVHIQSLRRKIERVSEGCKCIRTVYGRGYEFNPPLKKR